MNTATFFSLHNTIQFKWRFSGLLIVTFFLLIANPLFSQTKKELETKRKALQNEISQITALLSKQKKTEKNLLSRLEDINKKIDVRQEIINTIKKEKAVFTREINKNKKEITTIEKQLVILKNDYAKMVVQSYRSKNKNSRLLFLLSSSDFLQAYKRMQYMKQYANYRKKQAIDIDKSKENLLKLNDSLKIKKQEKQRLITAQIKERNAINSEKNTQQTLISRVKKKKRKYLAQIRKKQKKEQKFERQLQNLIKGVISKSNKKSGKKTTTFVLTPEAKKLALNFIANKGKLPAPVAKGYISRYYGKRKHEVMKTIDVKSNGWFYTTAKNANARAVFRGKVLAIMVDKKTKIKTVLIQHGNYITSYKNLKTVLVKKGDNVDTKENLGTIHTDSTTGKTILAFVLWKNATPQNPAGWIFK